jgi:4-hydroxy-2-oxoheptanedioate aldolase
MTRQPAAFKVGLVRLRSPGVFLKDRLREGDLLRGVINAIPSAVATQAIAAAGADFVIVDREHGPIGRETMHAMLAATAGTPCAPLVRVPAIDEAEVKTALDAGAEGVVYPLVRTAGDAERCVAYTRYPPDGSRGWGPFTAHSRFGTAAEDYLAEVGPKIACCLLIETAEAVENIDAILSTPGVDVAIVAKYDLSTALGVHGRFDAPEFTDAVATVERAAAAGSTPLGGAALTREQASAMTAAGYRLLIHGFDVFMLKQQVAAFATWT